MTISSSEELKQCRDRVCNKKDPILEVEKASQTDDYTATPIKLKKVELDFKKEIARINREYLEL